MEEILGKITTIIEDFNSSTDHHPEGLLTMGNNLTANIFFLEKFRAEAHLKHETVIFNLKNQGDKVNAATNTANIKVPELYMLRRFMGSAEKVSLQINVQLKWLHAELLSGGSNGR